VPIHVFILDSHPTAYELSKIEKKVGTPEAPISDLGQVSYDSYWKDTLLELLAQRTAPISVQEMSQITKMYHVDIQKTLLENLKVIRFHGPDNEYKVDFSGVNVDQYLKKVCFQLFSRTRIAKCEIEMGFVCFGFLLAETNRPQVSVCAPVRWKQVALDPV
jgi:hypothetical protein